MRSDRQVVFVDLIYTFRSQSYESITSRYLLVCSVDTGLFIKLPLSFEALILNVMLLLFLFSFIFSLDSSILEFN